MKKITKNIPDAIGFGAAAFFVYAGFYLFPLSGRSALDALICIGIPCLGFETIKAIVGNWYRPKNITETGK